MGTLRDILTIARWEVKKSFSMMGKNVLPLAIVLFVLLIAVTGFATQSGMHLQDGMYQVGVNDPQIASLIAGDPRFSVYQVTATSPGWQGNSFDLLIINGEVFYRGTEKSKAALKTVERDYAKYVNSVYNSEDDLFAAYPLWIDVQPQKSELDFLATQSGQSVSAAPSRRAPVPEGPVVEIPTPSPTLAFTQEELRQELVKSSSANSQISRYTEVLETDNSMGNFKTPSQLSPPLPFDSIILIFVFIFPLYFTSQFFMMSIMNERIERQGEALLSAPVHPWVVISGKALPYGIAMLVISAIIILFIRGAPALLLPLIPVMLFFLSSGLMIGLIARSFRELSFISIFFSTYVTAYLFFPSIFANIHVISLISPLTLMVNNLQGDGFTAGQYLFSTSLFFVTSAVLFYAGVTNFREERLFSHEPLTSKIIQFISSGISRAHPWASLFSLAMLTVPFVFMVQMMLLVLLFNLPMPLSLVLLLVAAAGVEEVAKSLGLYTIATRFTGFLTWKALAAGSVMTALGFLVAEKLLLLVTLSQIAESVFGTVLFSSLGLLYIPFLIHLVGILVTGTALKLRGPAAYLPGIMLATLVHCACNLYLIRGWIW
jgi:ABC-type Na+ efflux pump permease subunit